MQKSYFTKKSLIKKSLILLLCAMLLLSSCKKADGEETTVPETTLETTAEQITYTDETTAAEPFEDESKLTQQTAKPTNIQVRNSFSDRAVIYGEVEENYSDIVITNQNDGEVIASEKSLGPYFYIEISAGTDKDISITARAQGKKTSEPVSASVRYNDGISTDVFGGKFSRLFYTPTLDFYLGNKQTKTKYLEFAKSTLEQRIQNLRSATGKQTKLVYVICPNPITIYNNEQFDYIGNKTEKTPAQQFAEYMQGNEDIIVLDLSSVLREHKNEAIFHQTDTHWTELGAFYCYEEMMKQLKLTGYTLKDFDLEYKKSAAGDLAGFVGFKDTYEYTPYLNAKFSETGKYYKQKRENGYTVSIDVPSYQRRSTLDGAPSAYLLGDSYGANFLPYVGMSFTTYTNTGILWNYEYNMGIVEKYKPDYVIHVYTDRNVDTDLGLLLMN